MFREFSLAQASHSANGTLRGIGLDSEIVQVLCKAAAPFAESGLFDIESLTLFTHGFDDDVRLRMGFVGMERHDVAVLQRKFFAAEVSDGPEDIFPKASRLV